MYRKILIVGATAAAIVGVASAALAASGSDTTTGTASASSTSAKQHPKGAALRHALHGAITTKGKDGYVTHTGIRGAVTSVSPTSITVKAADGFSQTFTINKTTKVRERTAGQAKGTPATISDVKSGDQVGVLGKGADSASATPTATVVIDGLKK